MGDVSTSNDIKELKDTCDRVAANTARAADTLQYTNGITGEIRDAATSQIMALNMLKDDVAAIRKHASLNTSINDTLKEIKDLLGGIMEAQQIQMQELRDRLTKVEGEVSSVGGVAEEARKRGEKVKAWFMAYAHRLAMTYNSADGWNYLSTANLEKMYYFGNYDPNSTLQAIVRNAREAYRDW